MEDLDALVVEVDELQVVQLLQHEVRRVVKNARPRVLVHGIQEPLECHPVVHVFAGMDLEAHVDARAVERVQDRLPASPQLRKRLLDESRRALWPWIDVRPCERAGECCVRLHPEALGCLCGFEHDGTRPLLPLLGVAFDLWRSETIEWYIVGRVDGNQLTLQVRRQFRQRDSDIAQRLENVVAIVLVLGGLVDVDETRVNGDLYAMESQGLGPLGDVWERVEGGLVGYVLCDEDRGAVDGSHLCSKLNL